MLKYFLLILLLSGCAGTSTHTPLIVKAPVLHPSFPVPYSVCSVTWKVVEVGGEAMIALSFDDNITAAICDKEKNTYIEQLIKLTCFYRKDKSERICNKEENDNSKTST
jgi:hypothetical protein